MKLPIFLLAFASSLAAAPLNHWRLDGNTSDSAGTNTLTWSSTALYNSGVSAPGSTQAASIAPGRHLRGGTVYNYDGASPISACAWIKGGSQDTTIIGDMVHGGAYTGWELHVGTDAANPVPGTLNVWLISTYGSNYIQVNSPIVVLDNAWHFVAFTYDGSKSAAGVKIYVDGVDRTGNTTANSLTGSLANGASAELNLGSRQSGAAHNFNGLIDEARIFSNVLTPAEISSLYTSNSITDTLPPSVAATTPTAGSIVLALTEATVDFSEDVTGVNAADLLVNNIPAAAVTPLTPRQYRFTFPQPASGTVAFTWAAGHGIKDTVGLDFASAGWTVTLDPSAPQNAIISEFLTDNAGGLEDEDHSSPDWIEISNPGPSAVNLAGWHLTDDPANLTKWTFPAATLAVNSRLVVFASGKNRTVAGQPLHSDFKLDSGGGFLALTKLGGMAPFSSFTYGPQSANISCGLVSSTGIGASPADWRLFTTPTPGQTNSTDATVFGAALSAIQVTPALPQDTDDILITAPLEAAGRTFTPPVLRYRVMFAAEQSLTMRDDGLDGDAVAGDNTWSALIPAAASAPGQMVRWYVTASRSDGLVSRWPVYRSGLAAPEYLGTIIAEPGPVTQLPVYRVFASGYTLPPGTTPVAGSSLTTGGGYHALDTDSGARAALFFDGRLYDNVLFRIKGTTTRSLLKRSHRVDFNPGHYFKWSPDIPAQRELSLNSEYIDPSYSRQYLSAWLHRTTGTGAPPHFPVRMQMNGSFWKLSFHTYPLDDELMEFMGLNGDGALYRQVGTLTGGAPEKQARTWEDNSDYNDFATAISEARPLASRRTALFDRTDLPAVINDITVMRLTQEADDVWANMGMYRNSEGTGEWRPIPFDMNLSFGQLFYDGQSWNTVVHADNDNNKSHPLYGGAAVLPKYPNNPSYNLLYNRLYDAVMRVPETRAMLLRRMRTLMDATLGVTAAASPLETELDAHVARITQEANLDRTQWKWAPVSGANALAAVPFSQGVSELKNLYLAPRRTHLFTTHSVANAGKATVDFTTATNANTANAQIPAAQIAVPAITFGTIESNPPGGNQDQEYIELRNGNAFAVDLSNWTLSGGVAHTIKPGTVLPPSGSLWLTPSAVAFRARTISPHGGEDRYVQGGWQGHLDNRGEVLTLKTDTGVTVATITTPANPSDPQRYLVISEMHYNPPGSSDDTEFVELLNTGTSVTLDLTGVHFSAGIDFTFSTGRTLAPGARVLVVKDAAAFGAAYPAVPAAMVAGVFAAGSSLDNGGESVKLNDATGSTIVEFTFDDRAPWPVTPDGEGPSLVLIKPQPGDAWASNASHWRPSTMPGGNPGGSDAVPFTGNPETDNDGDGLSALLEYALGTSDSNPQDAGAVLSIDAAEMVHFPSAAAADDAALTVERSGDLHSWEQHDAALPLAPGARWFVRLRAVGR